MVGLSLLQVILVKGQQTMAFVSQIHAHCVSVCTKIHSHVIMYVCNSFMLVAELHMAYRTIIFAISPSTEKIC